MDNPIVRTLNDLFGVKEAYRAPDALLKILFNKSEREPLFHELLELFNYDVSFDWFHDYFQEAQADRKNFKQDFTPHSLSQLLSRLIEPDMGNTLDVAAGTGGILIQHWQEQRCKFGPIKYNPRAFWYQAEELSDRAIPFLIFNMAIRGMNGVILHGDALTRKFKAVYFIRNNTSDYQAYSEVMKMPRMNSLMKELNIKQWG